MEPNKSLFAVMKTDSEKTRIIIKNTLIMLSRRIYVDKSGNKHQLSNFSEATKSIEDRNDGTFTVTVTNNDKYAIKIVFQRISATGKQSIISEFFKDYGNYKKIIVARDFNTKISDYVNKHHTQIFKESDMLQDIYSYHYQPIIELLNPSEMEAVKKEYNATDYTIKKILKNDAITKYFALKKGEIIRIIRPSPTSGEAIDYRVVY